MSEGIEMKLTSDQLWELFSAATSAVGSFENFKAKYNALATKGYSHSAIESAIQVLRQVEAGDGVFVGQCADAIAGLEAALATEGGEAQPDLQTPDYRKELAEALGLRDEHVLGKMRGYSWKYLIGVARDYAVPQSQVDSDGTDLVSRASRLLRLVDEYEHWRTKETRDTLRHAIYEELRAAPQSQVSPRLLDLMRQEGEISAGGAPMCDMPPDGWYCTREKGHEGPCAAHPAAPQSKVDCGEAVGVVKYGSLHPLHTPQWRFEPLVDWEDIGEGTKLCRAAPQSQGEKAVASEDLFALIPEGWRFYTSDFSVDGSPGSVTLKRDQAGEKWWLSLTDEQHETTSLYQFGRGMTIEKALEAAIAAIAGEKK